MSVQTKSAARTVLEAKGLQAGYGQTKVVRDLDLHVAVGEIVALLGPNGAGKTTTLMTLAGALSPLGGSVLVDGNATRAPLFRRARSGLALVTERRAVLMKLTVAQNLKVARVPEKNALDLFPQLGEHLNRRVGDLSGGQQQMLALARALGGKPNVLLADELSLGLAPMVVDRLLEVVYKASRSGVGVLLVEQQVRKVLTIADRVVVMRRGRAVLTGNVDDLNYEEIENAYFAD